MKRGLSILLVTCVAIVGGASSDLRAGAPEQAASAESPASPHRALLDRYCVTCHNERLKDRWDSHSTRWNWPVWAPAPTSGKK